MELGGVRIVVSAMAAALAGWAVLALIESQVGRGAHALRLWRRIAIGVAIVSLIGPLTADAPASTIGSLVALHATVATAVIASMRSEEHTSELPSLMRISYAVFC